MNYPVSCICCRATKAGTSVMIEKLEITHLRTLAALYKFATAR